MYVITLDEDQNVFYSNGKKLGQFIMEDDGCYKFFPEQGGGYWSGFVLRQISDTEDILNKEWDEQCRKALLIGGDDDK